MEQTITRPSGLTIKIAQDDDSTNPAKDWDMVGTMVLGDRCGYGFGHEKASRDEIQRLANDPKNIVLPVYMYDHSGITINTTGFLCPWDSGQVGIMYCSKEKAVFEFGKKLCTKEVRDTAIKCMVGEVKNIDDFLTGNVWGFRVLDAEGEELESCWGFVGDAKYCLEQAVAAAEYREREMDSERAEAAYWQERGVMTEVRP